MAKALILLAVLCLSGTVLSHPEEDEIIDLPGLNYDINFRHYSGYLDGGDGKMLHYWFTEASEVDPSTAPLLLWLNGGPGCSSLDGLFTELGPYRVTPGGSELYENPYAWNTFANVVYLESPACVGFSYDVNGACAASDDGTSLQNYNALQHFFLKFPEYQTSDFYITGESYAGIYIPTLAIRVVDGNDTFPTGFRGFAIGNGMLSYRANTDSLMYFGYYHALLGQDLWDDLVVNCCEDQIESPDNCDFFFNMTTKCQTDVLRAEQIMEFGGLDVYNLYADCLHPESGNDSVNQQESVSRYEMDVKNMQWFRSSRSSQEKSPKESRKETRNDPPCTDSTDVRTYINDPAVRAAIHIPDYVQDWDVCSREVNNRYLRQYFNMHDELLYLIGKGRGLIYNGDVDMACNVIGNTWAVNDLELEALDRWQRWLDDSQQVGGFYQQYPNLDFVTIRGSGHMVPQDKPAPALQMIKSYVNQTPYSSLKKKKSSDMKH